jgi:NADH dehydrogenase/NADH:ubiquinone oxidoreductase subunit G
VEDLGVTGRGNSMEIGTYVDKVFDSEISGNVVDVCPVGALTSRPFAFTARPWELKHIETIDVLDAVGANIRVDVRGNKVLRILPRLNEEVNEEWIADKSRYSYDGLQKQRLDTPMIRVNGQFVPVSWEKALEEVQKNISKVKPEEIRALAGDLVDAEALVVFKDLMNKLGCENTECRQDKAEVNPDFRSNYLLNSSILGVEQADAVLLVGTNLRMEAPLLNARLRKVWMQTELPVGSIGPNIKSTFPMKQFGNDMSLLDKLARGESVPGFEFFTNAKRPMIIFGLSALRKDLGGNADYTYLLANKLQSKFPLRQEDWNGINFLQTAAARTAALDIGFVPGANAPTGDGKFYYLLGADEFRPDEIPAGAFVVYQGHHGDTGAARADVILPGYAYTEKAGTYVNAEGRVQRGMAAVSAPHDAREDWMILRALSEVLGRPLPYNSVDDVRSRLVDIAPHFGELWQISASSLVHYPSVSGSIVPSVLQPQFSNYWMTNPISRASKTLAKASTELPTATNSYQ